MKKILLYVLTLGFIPGFASAQSNFKPGYVISGNDTLKGFIDYRSWQENPSAISFKKTFGDESEIKYTPTQIKAFAVTGLEYYYSYAINISRDPVDIAYIKQGIDTGFVSKTVFLRLLSAGKNISLFDYSDDIKTRYYVSEGQSATPHELTYHVFYSLENSTQIITSYTYRNQLEYLAMKYHANDPKLDREIEFSQYSESNMIKITRAINQDTSKQFTPKSRFGLGWVVSAGINGSSLGFPYGLDYPYNTGYFPRISAGVDLFPNVNTQKVFLRCELSYSQSTHSFSHPADDTHYQSAIKDLTQSSFSVIPQVVINLYNTESLQIFVDGGLSVNFSSYNNYYLEQIESAATTSKQYQFPEMDKLWINFPLKAGIAIHRKVEIFAGYSPPIQVTPGYSLPSREYEYQAGVGYRFGAK